jgi:hypothetical protein
MRPRYKVRQPDVTPYSPANHTGTRIPGSSRSAACSRARRTLP